MRKKKTEKRLQSAEFTMKTYRGSLTNDGNMNEKTIQLRVNRVVYQVGYVCSPRIVHSTETVTVNVKPTDEYPVVFNPMSLHSCEWDS